MSVQHTRTETARAVAGQPGPEVGCSSRDFAAFGHVLPPTTHESAHADCAPFYLGGCY